MSEDDDDYVQRECVECKVISPPTKTDYTLISNVHGWRLTQFVVDGHRVIEWRCPSCWANYRSKRSVPPAKP